MAENGRKKFQRFSTFSLEVKVAVVLFVLIAVGGIFYGFRDIFFQLEKPFFSQIYYSGPKYLSLEEREAQEIENQKKNDTDEDGVNDYDEIYIFKTSPYLVDTDSDGVDDAQEIRLGKDPSCPEGENCRKAFASIDEEGEFPTFIDSLVERPVLEIDFSTLNSTEDLKAKIAQTSSADLREILLGTGIDPLIVEKLDDNQLRALFNTAADDAQQVGVIDQLLSEQEKINSETTIEE